MQACSPNLVIDADCIKRFQRMAMRLVKGFRRLPCEEVPRRLRLHSLNRRHLCEDFIVTCKLFSWGLDVELSLFSTCATRLESSPFEDLHCGIGFFLQNLSFITRPSQQACNKLPNCNVIAPSGAFKRFFTKSEPPPIAHFPF